MSPKLQQQSSLMVFVSELMELVDVENTDGAVKEATVGNPAFYRRKTCSSVLS